jgi:aryl-alcohol dehydrogenase-like predicted oxidoreductase
MEVSRICLGCMSFGSSDWRPWVLDPEEGAEIIERVQELAADRGVTMAQIALAWLLHKDRVDAPIVGTTSVEHLEDAVEALEISLSSGDLAYLEEPYEPVPVSGHD